MIHQLWVGVQQFPFLTSSTAVSEAGSSGLFLRNSSHVRMGMSGDDHSLPVAMTWAASVGQVMVGYS